MKYILSLLALCYVLVSCDNTSSESDKENGDDAILDPLDMVSDDVPHSELKISVNDFVSVPFTVMGPAGQIEEWKEKDKIYDTDTLRTIRFKNSIFRVMNHTYVDATIYDEDLMVVYDIHVGMSRQEFENTFDELEDHDHRPYVKKSENSIMLSCCADLDLHDKWEFEFYKDTLDLIKFDHYVDSDLEFPEIENSSEI